ncbi:hypothetical protein Btru_004304 [Bulinus truncatus]|nr:hypothetical protein Btru_004304 [Bulinus truncatus]
MHTQWINFLSIMLVWIRKIANKMTALHHACVRTAFRMCNKALLMAKADPQVVDQDRSSYTPSESGSAAHDQIDGMSPVFRTHTEKARAAMSVCDDESYTRTDAHSLHSFHSMDDELLSHHQTRNSSQPFLANFSSHLQENYNELKEDHDKLNVEYKNISKENIHLREKLEALQLKMAEIHQNESQEIKKLEEQLSAERKKVMELEKKLELVETQVKKESHKEFNHKDKEVGGTSLENIIFTDDFALSKLKTQILALKEENDHLKSNKMVDDLIEYKGSKVLQNFNTEISKSENEKKELLSQINKLQEEKDALESLKNVDAEDLLHQNSLMVSELEILRHELTDLQERMPTEAQGLDALISQNFEEVTFDEEGFVDGRDMTKEEFLQGQNQQLKAHCNLLNDELNKLRTTFDAILKAGDNLQADYDQLAAEKDAIQDDLEVAVREKQTVLAENEYLINDTNELHDSLNKLVHELEKMQEKFEAAQAECDDLKRSVTVASKVGEVSRLLEERDALQERCADLQETKDRLQHDHTILLEEVQSLTEEVNQLSIEKEQLTSELEETGQQNETLQNDFNQLEIDFGELLKEKEVLEMSQLNPEKQNVATQTEIDIKLEKDVVELLNVSEVQETMLKVNSPDLHVTWNGEEGLKKNEQVLSDHANNRGKIEILEGELYQLRKDFDELLKEKEMLEEFVNVWNNDHRVQVDTLLKEKKILEEHLNEARQLLSAEVQKSQQLEANVAKLTTEQEVSLAQRADDDSFQQLLTKLEQLEDEYSELLREKEAIEADYSRERKELQKVTAEFRKLMQEKSMLEESPLKDQERMQELENKQMLLWNKKTDLSASVSEDYEKLKAEYQELLSEKEDLADVVHGLTKHNVAIEKKVKNLQSSLAEAQAAVTPVAHLEELNRNHEEIINLKKQIAKLTSECVEWEKKHADTVSTYRTHLLSAVQGHMDPDVKDALCHIIEIRSMEQFC